MAENIIKEFVRKQASPVTIGVPKSREEKEKLAEFDSQPVEVHQQTVSQENRKIGRPRTYEKRAKISLYLPEDLKEKIVRIQHQNFKSSINDVMMEAVLDILKKYGY